MNMAKRNAVLHPIIYVRGYAMTRGEIDDTTADPFCGFNIGSTVFRATPDKNRPPRKFIFESPVLRLGAEGYSDVFTDGLDIADPDWNQSISRQSIIIYRYYDPASNLLGTGETPEIQEFAKGLSRLIERVRDLVCQDPKNNTTADAFRCYLVAHSMGGLVCRAFLQNPALDEKGTRKHVDKFFTYATPHNGIDMVGVNVPSWLSPMDLKNFNRESMADFLNLKQIFKETKRVDWLPEEAFPSERVFCLIGTNRSDYETAQGLSRTFVGHGSDGLVRIENAWVCGVRSRGEESVPTAKAFVYRSHSGYYGIVNSEESYQNLVRFLFGDIRVDIWLDVEEIRVPSALQTEEAAGKEIDALYQFEILASPRGKLWYLTRRVAEEDSVACLTHKEWKTWKNSEASAKKPLSFYLSTVFLDNDARVDKTRSSLAYSMTLGARVPDYEVERRLWLNEHYEGGYLFRDSAIVEIFPPQNSTADWEVKFDWQSVNPGKATTSLLPRPLNDKQLEFTIPFGNDKHPGIRGSLRFIASEWNYWNT
jgi:PGAP1-like protein